jgi:cell division transport system permease protein
MPATLAGGEKQRLAIARAAETLAGVPGVTEARALEREKAYELIKPWLGDVADLEDLPVPRLVAVELDRKTQPTVETLDAALKAQGLDATVDDHSLWIKDITRSAGVARWIGGAIFLLISGAAAAVIAFATRAGLAARRDVVEVLHLAGAEHILIAKLFQARFARIAATAGVFGAVAAILMGALLRLVGGGEGITPVLPVAWADLLAVVPCPLFAAVVAAGAARITASGIIREME